MLADGLIALVAVIATAAVGIGAVLLAVVLFAHHEVTARSRRRFAERLDAASTFLAPHLVAPADLGPVVQQARHRFGDRAVAAVLRRTRGELAREWAERISRALADMGEIRRLRRAARSRSDARRLAGVRGLAESGGADAGALLAQAAERDPLPEIRRAAREGLIAIGGYAAISVAVRSYLRDARRQRGWRRSFHSQMARLAPAELAALVSAGALEPEEESLAIESLGDAGDPRALPLARERLDRPEPEVRATAARVLGKLRDSESLGALLRALEDPEWYVRAVAARALEQLPGDAEVAAHLQPLLTDRTWWVRANAARTLSRRGEPGVGALIDMVASQDRYARDAALAALALVVLPEDAARRLKVMRSAAVPEELPRTSGPTERDA